MAFVRAWSVLTEGPPLPLSSSNYNYCIQYILYIDNSSQVIRYQDLSVYVMMYGDKIMIVPSLNAHRLAQPWLSNSCDCACLYFLAHILIDWT